MPTSPKTSRELCVDVGADPDLWWGRVNGYLCDAYHEGAADERQRTREAEQAAARAGAEAGALRVEVRQLCEEIERLKEILRALAGAEGIEDYA